MLLGQRNEQLLSRLTASRTVKMTYLTGEIMKSSNQLKLVSVIKPKQQDPALLRREKMIKGLNRQSQILEHYRLGEKTSGQWFWVNEDGIIFLPIKYGKVTLELSKGMYAIHCDTLEEVEDNLEFIRKATIKGELDNTLKSISKELRSKFVK